MKIEDCNLLYTCKEYQVIIMLDGDRKMIMNVTLYDDIYSDSIEGDTNIWNSLEQEEKYAVEDLLRTKTYY